jgi:hypothetical protein
VIATIPAAIAFCPCLRFAYIATYWRADSLAFVTTAAAALPDDPDMLKAMVLAKAGGERAVAPDHQGVAAASLWTPFFDRRQTSGRCIKTAARCFGGRRKEIRGKY